MYFTIICYHHQLYIEMYTNTWLLSPQHHSQQLLISAWRASRRPCVRARCRREDRNRQSRASSTCVLRFFPLLGVQPSYIVCIICFCFWKPCQIPLSTTQTSTVIPCTHAWWYKSKLDLITSNQTCFSCIALIFPYRSKMQNTTVPPSGYVMISMPGESIANVTRFVCLKFGFYSRVILYFGHCLFVTCSKP